MNADIPLGTWAQYRGQSVLVVQGPFQQGAWSCYIVRRQSDGRRITVHSNELIILEKVK